MGLKGGHKMWVGWQGSACYDGQPPLALSLVTPLCLRAVDFVWTRSYPRGAVYPCVMLFMGKALLARLDVSRVSQQHLQLLVEANTSPWCLSEIPRALVLLLLCQPS